MPGAVRALPFLITIALLADPLRVGEVLPVVRPTLLPSVPRVYEKVYSAVQSRFETTFLFL